MQKPKRPPTRRVSAAWRSVLGALELSELFEMEGMYPSDEPWDLPKIPKIPRIPRLTIQHHVNLRLSLIDIRCWWFDGEDDEIWWTNINHQIIRCHGRWIDDFDGFICPKFGYCKFGDVHRKNDDELRKMWCLPLLIYGNVRSPWNMAMEMIGKSSTFMVDFPWLKLLECIYYMDLSWV